VKVGKEEGEVKHGSLLTTGGLGERKLCGSMMKKIPFCLVRKFTVTLLPRSFDLGLFLFRGFRSPGVGSRHEDPRPTATQRLQGRRPSQPRWFR